MQEDHGSYSRHPSLLSEKQAAKRMGVARITLPRAREAGRIRFFRIGTRVLYSHQQLAEFLLSCERNGRKDHGGDGRGPGRHVARRKDNRVSSSRRSISKNERANPSATENTEADQASLPFSATR